MWLKKWGAGLVLAGFGVGAILWVCLTESRVDEPHSTPSAHILPLPSGATPVPENKKEEYGITRETVSQPRTEISFSKEMENARDFRVLHLKFLQMTGKGGGFYALNILMRCAAVRQMPVPPSAAAESRAQEAARVLREERCASFIPSEVSGDGISALARDPRLAADSLRRLFNESSAISQNPEKRGDLIQKYLQAGDPLLLEQIPAVLFFENPNAVYFDGKTYPQNNAGSIFSSAWMAALCEGTGGTCGGPGDYYVVDACALLNICVASRHALFAELTRRAYGEEGAALFDQVYPGLVAAVASNDSKAFIQ